MKKYSSVLILLLLNGIAYGQTNKAGGYSLSVSGFMENKGQMVDQEHKPNPEVKYLLCQPGFNLQLRKSGFSYDTYIVTRDSTEKETALPFRCMHKFMPHRVGISHFHRVDVELVGCDTNAEIRAEEKSTTYFNYFTEGTPQGGVSDVHYYQKITYKNIYPHIDLAFYASGKGLERPAEYEFIVHPGGTPGDIKLQYKGADGISLADNKLLVHVSGRDLTESIPSSYWADTRRPVQVDYTALDTNTYGFSIHHSPFTIQHSADLVIDPVPSLRWGTYYGGPDTNGGTYGASIALDSANNVYITGGTISYSGIATKGAYETLVTDGCSFVAKFNPTGSALLWGTYCAGEYGGTIGIAVDSHNNVYVTGIARGAAAGISTPGSYQPNYGGGFSNAFIDKFNPTGTALLWGSYFGGSDTDGADAITLDRADNVYITGSANSPTGIATPGAYQTHLGGNGDAFIAKFNPTGNTLLWATYYGGSGDDGGGGIKLDANSNVFLSGGTTSTSGIATPGAYQTVFGGGVNGDAFVAEFNASGTSLLWGTYYGGPGDEGAAGLALDANNNTYITGQTTSSSGIGTVGAYKQFYAGGSNGEAFVAKFNSTGSSLLWGTYYGGNEQQQVFGDGIAVDVCGNSYITGLTNSSSGMVTPGAYDTTFPGGLGSAFVAKFNSTGSSLLWGTYYAGGGRKSNPDDDNPGFGYAIVLDAQNNVYVTGVTDTVAGVATSGAYLSAYPNPADNGYEAFVARFDSTSPQFRLTPLNPTICIGKGVVINASGSTSYQWLPATGLSCNTCPNPIASPTTTTTYTLLTNPNGCSDTVHLTITVATPPVVAVNAPPPISCPGSPIMLTASASANTPVTYSWSPGGKTSDTITVYPTTSTIYTVVVFDGCVSTRTDTVKVDNPALNACCDKTIVLGDDTVITAGGSYIKKYHWEPSAGLSCDTCPTITVTPSVTTTYTVTGTDTMGCQVESLVTVAVEIPCSKITIPNVFTPDYAGAYGVNNIFYINSKGIDSWSVAIYDRWGKEVFQTTNPTQYWNGNTQNGEQAPAGVYYYIINGICQGTSFNKDGYLQLIR